jgi:malonate-semialdehyde dehydrogenase (acetylating) / methylmalonate-semialdehyde dehydrogenase
MVIGKRGRNMEEQINLKKIGQWIDGEPVYYDNGERIELSSPIDGKVFAYFQPMDRSRLDETLDKVKVNSRKWRELSFKKRTEVLYKFRDLLRVYRTELAETIHRENGKTMEEAYAEVDKAVELTEFACSIPSVVTGRTEVVSQGIDVKEVKEAVGIVASIVPFNFPLMVPMWTIPNALVLGNAIVIKPSDSTPCTLFRIAGILKEAGLPDGCFTLLNGGKEVSEALCSHPNIDAVTFVGSTPVAKSVYRLSTYNLKRCLAMGGAKNFILVTPEVNPTTTAKEILASAFGMGGQRCMAASVVVAINGCDNVLQECVKQAKEYLFHRDIPPLIRKSAVDKITTFLQQTKGEILCDGRDWIKNDNYPKNYIGPSIVKYQRIEDIPDEEIFGPTLEWIDAENIHEALRFQQTSSFANGASIFTDYGRMANIAASEFTSGMIGINIGVPVPRDPFSFGGLKSSKFGYGDITGWSSIEFLTNTKKITTKWNSDNKVDWMS